MFGFKGKNKPVYSTIKPYLTNNDPIEIRLILLSCGHQLVFELVDELFKKNNFKKYKPFKCPLCQKSILIYGSYNGVVYKYKQDLT
jgi:hypothetical protein